MTTAVVNLLNLLLNTVFVAWLDCEAIQYLLSFLIIAFLIKVLIDIFNLFSK